MPGPDPQAATSVTHEVAATLRGRITHGEFRPGMRLPSERALAAQLSVSRVTVVRALTRLRLEGLVVTRHGSGTFVAATDRLVDTIAARSPYPGPAGADALDLRWATTAGPADLVQAVLAAVHATLPAALHSDGTNGTSTTGESQSTLTELLARYLTRTGLPTRPDQLTLTSGAMTGLSLVLDVAAPPGGVTVTETPTYPGALRILSQRKRRVRGWPAGPDGWDPGYLARLMRQGPPGVLYVQPDGHNPTGATMPPATRETLGRTAAAAGWLVVTDETMRPLHLTHATTASEATTASKTTPATASLAATNDHVIAVSSLSKTVWGGLHLGWIRAPAATTRHLRNAADATGAGPSALDQITTAHLLPELDAIIGRRARLLTENLQHLEHRLQHLEHRLRGLGQIGHPGLRWHRPAAGVTLWLDLHPRSSHEVVRDCARRGVLLEPASTFAVDGHDDRHLRIPFTAPPATLDRVADALSQALER
jgi:DNA-binding transcriptional MocR family regulator